MHASDDMPDRGLDHVLYVCIYALHGAREVVFFMSELVPHANTRAQAEPLTFHEIIWLILLKDII